VTQLDQMTQQNAALVEESAAAAESLKDQSRQLAAALAGFKIGGGHAFSPTAPTVPRVVAKAAIQQARKASQSSTQAVAPKSAAKAPAVAQPAKPAATQRPAPAPAAAAPAGGGDDDWETF
jgi:hypothetical protein